MKTENFYIVRFYLNNEVKVAIRINKKDAGQYIPFFEDIQENMTGGITTWFRVDLDPKQEWTFDRNNSTEDILFS